MFHFNVNNNKLWFGIREENYLKHFYRRKKNNIMKLQIKKMFFSWNYLSYYFFAVWKIFMQ